VLAEVRAARSALAQLLLNTPEESLPGVFSNELAKLHLSIAGSGLRDLPVGADERSLYDQVLSPFVSGDRQRIGPGRMLAAMLYCRPDDPAAEFMTREVPDWLYGVRTAYLVAEPSFFEDDAALRAHCSFATRIMRNMHDIVSAGSDAASGLSPRARLTAHGFATFACPIQIYFGDGDLKDYAERRAFVLERNARASGLMLDWEPEPRPAGRAKIRIGVLMPHFAAKTETFATLPVFEHLDRGQFEIFLYAIEAGGSALEQYCATRADRMSILSRNPMERAATIRSDRLDILFFGSNLTAGTDECTTLALHRLAPVQIVSICCPVATCFPNIDYYLAGDLLAPAAAMQHQYRETLANIPGSGLCFSYGPEPGSARIAMDRRRLGVPDEAVLFISGANVFKITPNVRDAWATIISRVPGSVLALYPFNPNWATRYNYQAFIADIKERFARLGLPEERLKILKPLPGRAEVKALLRIADVYLDSFPYGGATSLIDTLEAGLPPVVTSGDVLRFRQAPSMLREISMPELIAESGQAYIELACKLGTDPGLRGQLQNKIRAAITTCPPFLDSRGFASKIARLFKALHERGAAQ